MRIRATVGAIVLVATLAAGTVLATPANAHAATATECARLQRRIAAVPQLERRIERRIDRLQHRISVVADPVRRERRANVLEPRIERLQALAHQIATQVAAAKERCAERPV